MFRRKMFGFVVAAAVTAGAVLPASALAGEQRPRRDVRFYDRVHRDYHNWNRDEDRLYRQYLSEQHHRYRAFARMNRRQQGAYWQWRHDHDRH